MNSGHVTSRMAPVRPLVTRPWALGGPVVVSAVPGGPAAAVAAGPRGSMLAPAFAAVLGFLTARTRMVTAPLVPARGRSAAVGLFAPAPVLVCGPAAVRIPFAAAPLIFTACGVRLVTGGAAAVLAFTACGVRLVTGRAVVRGFAAAAMTLAAVPGVPCRGRGLPAFRIFPAHPAARVFVAPAASVTLPHARALVVPAAARAVTITLGAPR